MRKALCGLLLVVVLAMITVGSSGTAHASPNHGTLLASGLQGAFGSTIGPDGALYVAQGASGKVSRVDLQTGAITTYASGLPKLNPDVGLGGPMDVTFIGSTAYVLVTLVSPDVGGSSVDGIYRVDGPDSFTVIANIGQFSLDNPPVPAFEVPTGLQFAFEPYRGGFLVTDGHHNRILNVTLDGDVSELLAFENTVPTGLAVVGTTIYFAEAGAVPHPPEAGKVLAISGEPPKAVTVAAGASLLVDVERGHAGRLYALSQGPGMPGAPAGAPSQADSGALVEVGGDGTLPVLVGGLNLPSSLEFVGDTAYVVTLTGEVWQIDEVSELAAVTPAKPVVSPPAAGDGGLLDRGSDGLWTLAVSIAAGACVGLWVWRRRAA